MRWPLAVGRAAQREARRFTTDTGGAIAIHFGVAMIALAGLIGVAVDTISASRTDVKLQEGLDAAVLAGARDGTEDWETKATSVFTANIGSAHTLGAVPNFTRDADGKVTGTVAVTIPTTLTKLLGINSIPVSARSVAAAESQ